MNEGTQYTIIKIEIGSMMEIPLAYQKALDQYTDGKDVWDAKIDLKQVNFERNFRRSNYECVFHIKEGKYLYGHG